MLPPRWSRATASCLIAATLVAAVATRAYALPPGFTDTPIGGTWNEVNALAFSDDGTRMFVVERGGKVWLVENGVKQSTPFLDISDEVGAWRDFGMLGFALHPNFDQNGIVYAFYVMDRYYLFNHGTPGYDPSKLESQQYQATIGRLSRFTADPATGHRTILPGSEVVLLGATPSDGPPITYESHGTGQVVFGQDDTLLVSMGDGASYDNTDTGSDTGTYYAQALQDGILHGAWENVGAWRAQEPDSLSGKILRLDPFTGAGVPGNPWYDPANPHSTRSRVFALGLRNPYRFTLRPGTGTHDPAEGNPGTFYIGDVGWNDAESMHVLHQRGQNFGWPAFEGINQRATSTTDSTYWNAGTANPLAKNPLAGSPGCSFPFLRFRDLIVQESQNPPSWPNPCNASVQIPDTWTDPSDGTVYHYDKFVHSRPPISWRNDAWVSTFDGGGNPTYATMGTGTPVPGPDFAGNTSTGGTWYTATDFPPEWQNTYFHGDYGAGWIKSFGFDSNNQLQNVVDFLEPGHSVTFVATNPVTGGIYYVNWGDTVGEIRWVGTGNSPPNAVAEPAVSFSASNSLAVQFTGTDSSDPDAGTVLSYLWDFGDGTPTSTQPNPLHTFTTVGTTPHSYTVTLTVTDQDGHPAQAQALVSLNNTPPSVTLTSPQDGGLYSMAAPMIVPVRSTVSDAEQPTGSLTCSLLVELVHNNHTHPNPPIPACSADVTITPAGCDGNTYHWRFTLTVTDPLGLASKAISTLAPDCSTVPNQPPLAQPDSVAVRQGATVQIDVLANDSDADGVLDPSTVRIETPPSAGSVTVDPVSGTISYTQNGSPSMGDSFAYSVEDNEGARSNTALVAVSVASQLGLVAAYAFDESGGGTALDSSGHGNQGTLSGVTRTTSGRFGSALVFDGTSSIVTVPDSNSLDLTTAMTLEAWVYPTYAAATNDWRDVVYKSTNDIYYMEATSDQGGRPAAGGTFANGPLYGSAALPLNSWSHLASTYDGATLRLYVDGVEVANRSQTASIPTSTGPLTLGGDPLYGQYFQGLIDEVRVYARALSGAEIQSDMLAPVNDAPVAVADQATVAEGGAVLINVAANDSDAEGALDLTSIQVVSNPTHGSVTIHTDGTVTYTHDGSETTSDSFSYTIRDAAGYTSGAATVSVTITPVNDAPTAVSDSATVLQGGSALIGVAANDTDPEGALDLASIVIASGPAHGSVSVHPDGTVTYTHDGSHTTSDSFSYTIRDAGGLTSNAATVSLTVTPVNQPPVAVADSATVLEGGSVVIGVAANDVDPEGALDLGSIQIVSGPAHGSVTVQGDGSVVYTHDGSQTTSDSFSYRIKDTMGASSNTASVSITVTPVNHPPTAGNDAATLPPGGSVSIEVAANDSDPEGALDLNSIVIVADPTHGSVEVLGNGSVKYTHDGGGSTHDSFTYKIRDAEGAASNVATVTLTISSVPPQVPALPPLALAALAAALLGAARIEWMRAFSRASGRGGCGCP